MYSFERGKILFPINSWWTLVLPFGNDIWYHQSATNQSQVSLFCLWTVSYLLLESNTISEKWILFALNAHNMEGWSERLSKVFKRQTSCLFYIMSIMWQNSIQRSETTCWSSTNQEDWKAPHVYFYVVLSWTGFLMCTKTEVSCRIRA